MIKEETEMIEGEVVEIFIDRPAADAGQKVRAWLCCLVYSCVLCFVAALPDGIGGVPDGVAVDQGPSCVLPNTRVCVCV